MLREEKLGETVMMKKYNWSEDWEAENRLMGELLHVAEGYWEGEDGNDEDYLNGRE